MDFSFFEKLNVRKFRKMTNIGHKPRRLVIHPRLNNFISRIIDGETIQKQFNSIHFFDDDFKIMSDEYCYAFIIPPEVEVMRHVKFIVDLARNELPKSAQNPKFFIELWFQPRINNVVCAWMIDMKFAPQSIIDTFPSKENPSKIEPYRQLEVYNLELDVTPLDDDVLTIESRYSFVRAWSFRDLTVVSEMRQALNVIRSHTGFVNITAIGSLSSAIARTLNAPSSTNQTQLILIDRSADLITPTITQMNYEGIIAEFFGIDCGLVKITNDRGQSQLQLLSSQEDQLFGSLRSMTHQEASAEIENRMAAVTGAFGQKSAGGSLEEGLAKFRKTAKVSVENKTLIDHINIMQKALELMNHSKYFKRIMNEEANALSGASSIKQLVTQMMESGADFRQVIRMLCLESLLKGGVEKDYQKFVNQIIFNYGFQMVLYLIRLQDCGLFSPNNTKWSQFVKSFQLFVPDWDQTNDQAAAPYLGYVPLSVRYIQRVLNNDFNSIQKAMGELKQECYENCADPNNRRSGNVLVCFVGGCTHSELNALRRLRQKDSNYANVQFQLLTTNMTSSNEFFENLAYLIPGWTPTI
ncbi:Sec1 family protein [Tritrichomonas foetus]|uniref:Sec1 family protein n=1 Tax=Tritrichomonas foetus TaxID=1144522 RepID=A0A1J4JJJ3_9EUKA|nr:Sec1 family protein [Tritrichomonas foetus]|eukprot:OHS97733.1 Sec1 family protein [Tritrichomonas foetus]